MGGPTGRRALGPALLVAGVVLVGGCSDAEPPGTVARSTTAPTSSTATPTPSPTTPEQQVEAAARDYFSALQHASRTGQTSSLERLIDTSCPCYRVIPAIQSDAQKGLTTPDATWTVRSVSVHKVVGASGSAAVRFDVNAYELVDGQEKVVSRVPARHENWDLIFVRSGDGWVATNVVDLGG